MITLHSITAILLTTLRVLFTALPAAPNYCTDDES